MIELTRAYGDWKPLGIQGFVGPLFVSIGKLPNMSGNPWGIYLGWRIEPAGRFASPKERALWHWAYYA